MMAVHGAVGLSNSTFRYIEKLIITDTAFSSKKRFLYAQLLGQRLKRSPLLGISKHTNPFPLQIVAHLIENACAICLSQTM